MGRVKMDSNRYLKIKSMLEAGVSVRQISQILSCCDKTVKKVREGEIINPSTRSSVREVPGWSQAICWDEVLLDVGKRHLLSDLWAEKCLEQISYSQFTREFHLRFPLHGKKIITHREFNPGDRVEVDYAGFCPEWIDPQTLVTHKVNIFVGSLCFSQRIFATTSPTQSSEDFLYAHVEMFEYFGGVPRAIVPDNLKAGVNKPHLYDPEINSSYQELAEHYNTVILPARVRKPQDKSFGEIGVKLVTRFFRFHYRKYTFTSAKEIKEALKRVCELINHRIHTRFRVSRNERFKQEVGSLKALPESPFEFGRWEKRKLHPDCHISIDGNYYSAPEKYRYEHLDIKFGFTSVEIFFKKERIAFHKKAPSKKGTYVTDISHLPERSRAYLEVTPQKILHQAKFISTALHDFINELFQSGTLENLRRSQGFLRSSYNEINKVGRQKALCSIERALKDCRLWSYYRVAYYQNQLKFYRTEKFIKEDKPIQRKPGNPNLRYSKITPHN